MDDRRRTINLRLADLMSRQDEISYELGVFMSAAACVCLEEQQHQTGVPLTVLGDRDDPCCLWWDSSQASAGWNQSHATEYGAIGIAALLTAALLKLRFTACSRTYTGFDYYLSREGEDVRVVQGAAVRLETSGIRTGTDADVERRANDKRDRFRRYRTVAAEQLLVVIVEFGTPKSKIVNCDYAEEA